MSDNIPLEIQTDIIQRIPDIKWLIRCRSVSKAWKSVIDSKDFVTAYTLRYTTTHHHQANRHLLIKTEDCYDTYPFQVKYVSIVDDDTFPHQKVSVFVPDSVNKIYSGSVILGSSHGLFCLYVEIRSTAVIWNPLIRKTVAIVVPNVLPQPQLEYRTVVGFGVCPENLDPKLVMITRDFSKLRDVYTSTHVEVFTLSSGGTWRSPLSSNVPHKSIRFGHSQAVVDGFIYWDAFDCINVVDGFRTHNLIMSFDLTTEEFTKVHLPDRLALVPNAYMLVSILRESLVVLKFNQIGRDICDVWMMTGHGCSRSFNRLYSIHAPNVLIYKTLGFRKTGAPIIEVENDNEDYYRKFEHTLAIYEPELKSFTNIGVLGFDGSFSVHPYMETLLLLGH